MTVKELYNELKKEIENGHADIPVMINEYVDWEDGYCGGTKMTEIDGTTYHEKGLFGIQYLELGRY